MKKSNIYLFYGSDAYIRKTRVQEVIRKSVEKDAVLMNKDTFDEKNFSVEAFYYAAETLPFMSDSRIVLLQDVGLFSAKRKADSSEIEKYLPSLSETTVVIFSESQADKRVKLFKTMEKLGQVCECRPLPEKELKKWVADTANQYGKTLDVKGTEKLIRTVGNDMELLVNEISKLSDYTLGTTSITIQDIELVCSKSLEANIFDMINALGNKNSGRAIEIYNNLIMMKESPFGIMALISRQFKNILLAKELQKKGCSNSEIASAAGIPPFAVSECIRQSKKFTSRTLYEALCDCQETDAGIKQGKLNDKLGVELLIIKYSSNKGDEKNVMPQM